MNKRTVLGGVAAAAMAVAASMVVMPTAAQAVYSCQNGEVCIYSDYDLKGTVLVVYSGAHNFTSNWHFYNGLPANDNASSIVNKSNLTAFVSEDFDGKGYYNATIKPGKQMNFKGREQLFELPNDTMSYISLY
ncbi:peptidase inhibitor family I36 protein [Actinoplanes sp. HUAS TT8]|uniref:peptidase inhibitor family I36 protein n=1 Tax=Actinoplanes sp. HUAS TT8 TaxID=3447453 RepID=UPI003F52185C